VKLNCDARALRGAVLSARRRARGEHDGRLRSRSRHRSEAAEKGPALEPAVAWGRALASETKSNREKPCPKGAFLGLCEEGLIVGVRRGSYTRSVKNKRYAVNAVKALRDDPGLADNIRAL
jgi:hypothetical protein